VATGADRRRTGAAGAAGGLSGAVRRFVGILRVGGAAYGKVVLWRFVPDLRQMPEPRPGDAQHSAAGT